MRSLLLLLLTSGPGWAAAATTTIAATSQLSMTTPVPAEIGAVAAELEREGAHVDFETGKVEDKQGHELKVSREAVDGIIEEAKTTLNQLETAFADPAEIDAGEEAERLPALTKLFALSAVGGGVGASLGWVEASQTAFELRDSPLPLFPPPPSQAFP